MPAASQSAHAKLSVSSPTLTEGQPIPKAHTADGENTSPALAWSGAPAAATSFAVVCEGPDVLISPTNPQRARAAALGLRPVTAVESTIDLARAARLVRPGGVVAMMESHLDALVREWHSWPVSPAYAAVLDVMLRTVAAAGGRTDMGLRLRGTFLEAGLPDPVLDVHGTLSGSDAPRLCRYMADSLRSMAAMAERLGVDTLVPSRIDDLERAMLNDAARPGAVMNGPVVVTAWCRTS